MTCVKAFGSLEDAPTLRKGLNATKGRSRALPTARGHISADPHYSDYSDCEEEEDLSAAPAVLINKETQRQLCFKPVLNSYGLPSTPFLCPIADPIIQPEIEDPISAGIIDEDTARGLFDLIFLHLNPFINLFDPALHSVSYVRSRSPFLFTTLLMAACKFFKPESFNFCQKMAEELANRAFGENWKSVEVVQAFSCLCYWRNPEDTVRIVFTAFFE
jgi:hypothetical protein